MLTERKTNSFKDYILYSDLFDTSYILINHFIFEDSLINYLLNVMKLEVYLHMN